MHNKKKGFGSWVFIAGFAVQTAALSQPAAVNPSPSTPSTTPPAITPSAHALSSADLEAWLGGYFPNALNAGDIAGGGGARGQDGPALVEKGYGFADFEKRVPVDPKATLFRWGSVSKLFTWTAVMQLVEQGKIDLDADVSRYLDFPLPVRPGHPLTLRHVMTQTSGFEEVIKDLVSFGKPPAPLREV